MDDERSGISRAVGRDPGGRSGFFGFRGTPGGKSYDVTTPRFRPETKSGSLMKPERAAIDDATNTADDITVHRSWFNLFCGLTVDLSNPLTIPLCVSSRLVSFRFAPLRFAFPVSPRRSEAKDRSDSATNSTHQPTLYQRRLVASIRHALVPRSPVPRPAAGGAGAGIPSAISISLLPLPPKGPLL